MNTRRFLTLSLACVLTSSASLFVQGQERGDAARQRGAETIGPIEDKVASFTKIDGFFPLYWDEAAGKLWLEVPRLNSELLLATGIAAGLGSNDIGIDRGMLTGRKIVSFERVGPRLLLVQPNYQFRSSSGNAAEVRSVRDSFARSVLWSFPIAAKTADRILVDATEFFVRDAGGLAERLQPGTYRFESNRCSVYRPMTQNFPKNTEVEAELTFVRQPGGGRGGDAGGAAAGRVGRFFEGVTSVAASGDAASVRVHYSLVELPDENYRPRRYDPRSGYSPMSYQDYSAPLGQPLTQRLIHRHRLAKKDPTAAVSEAVKPIIYYLDPGAPEPIRSALLDGARWWNQAFEAAGYRDAFRVELLPEEANPLDIRYNVINWVHRSSRGWSTGDTVYDPRTGEVIKGVVTLGSQRIRQDYMIAEGLLAPYVNGDETPPELSQWALARIRQLSAHELGHTLGLGHNYYDSEAGRISVMDYPHPLVTLKNDGTLDHSDVYAVGIGAWDKVAIAYGYQDFPTGTDEAKALTKILDDAWAADLRYLTNQDLGAHPRVDQWSNGTDSATELRRMMKIRRLALSRFGERVIKRGQPMAQLEEVLVPVYLHHRYQIEAAAASVGGIDYSYALRGDGRRPVSPVPAGKQRAALEALLATIKPSELALPSDVLANLPPRPSGFRATRELFPRYTGLMFDAITPAVVAADLTISNLLENARAARLVEQQALDPSLPGLNEVIIGLVNATFGASPQSAYEAEIARATQRVLVENLITLASSAPMPQVRAIAANALERRSKFLAGSTPASAEDVAHVAHLASDIRRFLERPSPTATRLEIPDAPPGAPIGEPAMEYLRKLEPACSADGELFH